MRFHLQNQSSNDICSCRSFNDDEVLSSTIGQCCACNVGIFFRFWWSVWHLICKLAATSTPVLPEIEFSFHYPWWWLPVAFDDLCKRSAVSIDVLSAPLRAPFHAGSIRLVISAVQFWLPFSTCRTSSFLAQALGCKFSFTFSNV